MAGKELPTPEQIAEDIIGVFEKMLDSGGSFLDVPAEANEALTIAADVLYSPGKLPKLTEKRLPELRSKKR